MKQLLALSCITLGLLLLPLLLQTSGQLHAQSVESDERAMIDVKDGVSFKRDSLFLMNLRFRMQNRAGFNTLAGDRAEVEAFEMRIRRLRLRFDGYVLSPKFQYYIQLSFSRADMDLELGEVAQPIRDAILYYTVNENLYFGFGQVKLPGNRQRVISSGNLQFADRSIVNGLLTLDRDFGLYTYYTLPRKMTGPQVWQIKTAITSGDGRNALAINNGLAYTGRLEWLPFGYFSNNGDYSEGDIEFEPRPKLSLGLTYSANQKAVRTQGQLGAELFEARNLNSLIADLMFKYQGWALMSEYMQRNSPDPITTNEAGDIRLVVVGRGINTQLSRMVGPRLELAARYAYVVPNQNPSAIRQRVDEGLFGVTKYLNGHRIKVQGNVGYRWLQGLTGFSRAGNTWTGMFQVEFGI
ncbi:MAG: porin [Nitritalea sp.]